MRLLLKNLLFTGSSGFLGLNIIDTLRLEYDVDTLGISDKDKYCIDISKNTPFFHKRYDIILHAAGKAHNIPKNDYQIQQFYDINYHGTIRLCNALESAGIPDTFIFISSVAVYGLKEGYLVTEDAELKGTTPYAKSKILAEQFLKDWCEKHCVNLTILRPSLLAGKNPPGNLGSMINGIRTGRYFRIAGGKAKKSVAMVNDIARIIPYCESTSGVFNLCDSHNPSFYELEKLICSQVNIPEVINIPYSFALVMAKIGDILGDKSPINTKILCKIVKDLTFSNKKMIEKLGFTPSNVLSNFFIE